MLNLFLSFIALLFFNNTEKKADNGLFAEIETTKGKILFQLEYEKTPITVANFVSLAEGNNPLVSEKYKGKRFYDGLKFNKVIQNFIVQAGTPEGTENLGYKFNDEFIPELKHNSIGTLTMGNSGPNTNGSQFFITLSKQSQLDNKHTVFGHIINGLEVINKITAEDKIIKITILRKGSKAIKFDAPAVFKKNMDDQLQTQKELEERTKKIKSDKANYFNELKATATKSETGLVYKIFSKENSKKPETGSNIYVYYSGFFEDGSLFSSNDENLNIAFEKWDAQDAVNGYKPFPFQVGKKTGLIPGFLEGIEKMNIGDKAVLFIPANLGYGAKGTNSIPPNSNLIFEVEILDKMP